MWPESSLFNCYYTEGATSFPGLPHFTLDPYFIMLSVKEVFGMTRPGIEPRSPGPLANTLSSRPMAQSHNNKCFYLRTFLVSNVIQNKTNSLWAKFTSFNIYSGSRNLLISLTLNFLGNTNEWRNFSLTTQQRKFFYLQHEIFGLLLMLQDSWSLGLLVLETKWLSGMLRWQRVLRDVWGIVFKVTV